MLPRTPTTPLLLALTFLGLSGCSHDPGITPSDGGADDALPMADGGVVDAPTDAFDDASGDAGPDTGPIDDPTDYPADPYSELEASGTTPGVYEGTSTYGDGRALFNVWAPPAYTRERRWPLIVYLHGGGNLTDTDESLVSGAAAIRTYAGAAHGEEFVWMGAVVRVPGSYHAWALEENALDIIDALREVARLFRVDHRRVYLLGSSMGGGGVATLSWVMPDAFAAFAPVAGYYWNEILAAPDLDGVAYRVVAGELDRPPMQPFDRLGLATEFVALSEAAGATVEFDVLTGVGHSYPLDAAGDTHAFFLRHELPASTDWEAVRETADAVLPLFSR